MIRCTECGGPMDGWTGEHHSSQCSRVPRTVLVHLNVSVPADDPRDAEEVAACLMDAVDVGSDDDSVRGLVVACVLAEEIS